MKKSLEENPLIKDKSFIQTVVHIILKNAVSRSSHFDKPALL